MSRQSATAKRMKQAVIRKARGPTKKQVMDAAMTVINLRIAEEDLLTLVGIERALAKITAAGLNGKIPLEAASRAAFLLDRLAKVSTERQKLQILQDHGIPFVGLTLIGPSE